MGAVVSASLPDLSCLLLSLQCFCYIVSSTNKHEWMVQTCLTESSSRWYSASRCLTSAFVCATSSILCCCWLWSDFYSHDIDRLQWSMRRRPAIAASHSVARGALGACVPPGLRKEILGPNLQGKVVSPPPRQSKSPIFIYLFNLSVHSLKQ